MIAWLLLLLIIPQKTHCLSAHHLHQFMWANIDTFSNNQKRALQRYQHIAGQSVWSYYGYIPFLFDHHKYDTIVSLAQKIDTHFSKNPQLQLLLALAYKKTNNHNEGDKRIATLAVQHPTQANIILRATQLYVDHKEPHKALALLEKYLNKSPHKTNNFLFYFLKGQIHAQLKEHTQALDNIEKCLHLHPSYSQAWLMRAVLEEQKGNIQNAITGYSQFLGLTNNSNGQHPLQHHLTKLMIQQSTVNENNKNLSINYESHLDKAILFFTQKRFPQALIECNNYIKHNPQSIKAKLLKVQIYTAQNSIDHAITVLRKEIEHNPDNDLWYKTIYHLKEKGHGKNNIEEILRQYAEKYPKSLSAQLYTADILLRSTRHHEALPYLLKAEPLAHDTDQKISILYQQALIFYDTKKIDSLHSTLKKITDIDPRHGPAHNLLAYSAAKQKQFDLAHSSITICLSVDPNNHHYLDTKGYILYKEKKYIEAEKIFASLAASEENDPHILTHLKKTYNKQNKALPPLLQAHNTKKE